MLLAPRIALSAALLVLGSCATAKRTPTDFEFGATQPGITISSQPPGAEVWIDGDYSGFCTPCVLEVESGDPHRIELRLAGYETIERHVVPHRDLHAIPWREGDLNATHWRFPLFLTLGGFLWPIRLDSDPWPSRMHARMRLSSTS
jgi:hypothetical protein